MRLRPSSTLFVLGALAGGSVLSAGCDTAEGPSLYDPVASGSISRRPDPTVSAMAPVAGAVTIGGRPVAGLTVMAITGTNFNPSAESTFVYVGSARVPVLSVTPTRIEFRAPNQPAANLPVKVGVLRAQNFAAAAPVTIVSAFERWGELGPNNAPFGVATDGTTGYVSLNESGASVGIHRLVGPGKSERVVTTTFQWPELAYAGGYVYGVRGVQAVFRFAVPNGAQEVWYNQGNSAVSLRAIDIDPEGNVWAGGAYTGTDPTLRGFYRVTPAKVATRFSAFTGEVRALDVTGGFVYIGGVRDGVTGVWRYPISNGTLGAEEAVATFGGAFVNVQLNALAVAASGEVLLATNHTDPILIARGGTVEPYYPNLLTGTATALRWVGPTRLLISGAKIRGTTDSERTGGDVVVAEAFLSSAP